MLSADQPQHTSSTGGSCSHMLDSDSGDYNPSRALGSPAESKLLGQSPQGTRLQLR